IPDRPVLLGIGSKGSRRVRKTARYRPSARRRVRSPSAGRLLPHDTFRDLWPTRRPSQGAGIRCRRRCHLPGTGYAAAAAGSDRLMRPRRCEVRGSKSVWHVSSNSPSTKLAAMQIAIVSTKLARPPKPEVALLIQAKVEHNLV